MRTFHVNVNGTSYEVQIEEIQPGAAKAAPAVPLAPPAPPAPISAGREALHAPMPGTILSVAVKAGDAVKKGQLLLVLEAMKMENEIVAPQDGTVTNVAVAQGNTVSAGDLLLTIA